MSSPTQPAHLSNHQRSTLRQIFQHPAGHNIEWRAVLSLLRQSAQPRSSTAAKLRSPSGPRPNTSTRPHKDIGTQAVASLRRMLTQAGDGADAADAGASGREA